MCVKISIQNRNNFEIQNHLPKGFSIFFAMSSMPKMTTLFFQKKFQKFDTVSTHTHTHTFQLQFRHKHTFPHKNFKFHIKISSTISRHAFQIQIQHRHTHTHTQTQTFQAQFQHTNFNKKFQENFKYQLAISIQFQHTHFKCNFNTLSKIIIEHRWWYYHKSKIKHSAAIGWK